MRLSLFSEAQRKRRFCSSISLWGKQLHYLGLMSLLETIMLKVNIACFDDIEALANLLKDSQLRPFRFWNKAIVSLENYSSRLLSGSGRDLIPNHGT